MTDEETLADVDHTHPHTGETFGGVYRRGPAVADGSGPGVGCEVDDGCLGEVDHATDRSDAAAAGLWKRGPEEMDVAVDANADGDRTAPDAERDGPDDPGDSGGSGGPHGPGTSAGDEDDR